jgi:hypothetical protein
VQRSSPCYSSLLCWAYSLPPPLLCVSFQFLVYCSVFSFAGGCLSTQQAMLVIPGVAWRVLSDAWCSPVGLLNVSQAGLELASVSMGAFPFSQCKVVWRSCVGARDSGFQTFYSSWCFISAKCGYRISARFLICRSHTVCFCTLVSILDPFSCLLFLYFTAIQYSTLCYETQK